MWCILRVNLSNPVPSVLCYLYSVNPALRSWLCSRSAIQTSLIALAYSQSSLYSKTFTSLCARCRAENPRIIKARSSYEISHEPEWTGAWQYVSISLAMWHRKRQGCLYVLSCLQVTHKCAEYQWINGVNGWGWDDGLTSMPVLLHIRLRLDFVDFAIAKYLYI